MLSRLCLPFLLTAGGAALGQTPVTLQSSVDSRGSGEAVITNQKSVPLTAYAIQVFLEPCSPTPRPPEFRAVDTAATSGAEPLQQFQSRTEPLGVAYCNKDRASVPATAELKAAIYQDGSSSGEPKWVSSLLDSRRFELEQLETVIDGLRAPYARSVSRRVLTADLEKRLTASQGEKTLPFPCPLDVRALALSNFKIGADGSLPEQIAHTLQLFERLRNKLLEARPALR